jgi:hypothetical protein
VRDVRDVRGEGIDLLLSIVSHVVLHRNEANEGMSTVEHSCEATYERRSSTACLIATSLWLFALTSCQGLS